MYFSIHIQPLHTEVLLHLRIASPLGALLVDNLEEVLLRVALREAGVDMGLRRLTRRSVIRPRSFIEAGDNIAKHFLFLK